MTLRSRLAATYAAVILAALLVFAAGSVFAIDRTLRSGLDARLSTEAFAAASLVDVRQGRIVADADDRRQFLTLVAAGDQGMVTSTSGRIIVSSVLRAPAELRHVPLDKREYYTVGSGESVLRVLVLPVLRGGVRDGNVIVWRGSDWIEETDRGSAVAFILTALVIAALAVFAGSLVTSRALEDAFARQRRFTADASHELRAPLAVIRAEADLALRKERSASAYRSAMDAIAFEADRMEALIGDMLAAARAESRSTPRERVDVGAIAANVTRRLASAAAVKGTVLHLDADPNAIILGDAHALERAVLAIAHNAVKFAPETAGSVTLQVRRNKHAVEMAVRDNGPGFTETALQHALERFWREDTGRAPDGTGLGLSIAKAIVEATGGSICVTNGVSGAEVQLRFPAI